MEKNSNLREANLQKTVWTKTSEQVRAIISNKWFGFLLKLLVSGAALAYIIDKVWYSLQSQSFLEVFHPTSSLISFLVLLIPMSLLMTANWGLEVIKWKALVSKEYPITWRRSVKSILSGTTFGVFSPNRSGEFIGRILALPMEQRMKGAVLSFVNGLAQTLATYTFGVLGIIFLLETHGESVLNSLSIRILQITLVLTVIILLSMYLNFRLFARYLASIKFIREKARYVNVLKRTDRSLLIRLYNLSIIRFSVFLAQYALVFIWIGVDHDWLSLGMASVLSLFSSTIVPFLPIPDLLVRESVALSYFDLYGFDQIIVSAAVLYIWLLNIALPAIIGAIVLFTYRIFRR